MKDHACDLPDVDDMLDQELEDWTCPTCGKQWELGWEESWDSVYRLWEPVR